MEWNNANSIKLIEVYRKHQCLWNPLHGGYKSKTQKNKAWDKISEVMKCDSLEMKKKLDSLLGSFRRERQKQEKSTATTFKSTWFAFKHMQFLLDKFGEARNTEPEMITNDIINIKEELDESELSSRTQQSAPEVTQSKKRLRHQSVSSEEDNQTHKENTPRDLRDHSSIFGEHVALKHRKYSAYTQSVVEHQIANILFNADMGQYDQGVYSTASSAPMQNPVIIKVEGQHALE